MRLRRIEAVRFGGLREASLPPQDAATFGDGLNVVIGPNEAGKSSFTALVRHVLYGFPDGRRGEPLYLPPDGGRLARLVLEGDEGRLVVERADARRVAGEVTVRPGGDGALERLTRGVPEPVFRNVFGFGLTELSDLATLGDISQRLYASAAGLTISPHEVRRRLAERAEAQWSAQGRTKQIHKLDAQLKRVTAELRELERAADAFRADRDTLAGLSAEVARAEAAWQDLEAERARLARIRERVTALQMQRRNDAELAPGLRQRLASLQKRTEVAVDEAVLPLAEPLERLSEELALFRQSLTGAREARTRAATGRGLLADTLARKLGPSWNQARLMAVPGGNDVDLALDERAEAVAAARQRAREAEAERERLAAAALEAERVAAEAAARAGVPAGRHLRAEVGRRAGAVQALQRGADRGPSRFALVPRIAAFGFAGVLLAAGLFFRNWPLALSAIAPLAVGVLLVAGRLRGGGGATSEYLQMLDLASMPDAARLVDMAEALGTAARLVDEAEKASMASASATVVAGKAADEETRALKMWSAWLEENGLAGETTEPISVRQVLREVRQAQGAFREAAAADAEASGAEARCAQYRDVAVAAGVVPAGFALDDVPAAVVRMQERVRAAVTADGERRLALQEAGEVRERLLELETRVAQATQESAALLADAGAGEGGLPALDAALTVAAEKARAAQERFLGVTREESALEGRLQTEAMEARGTALRLERAGLVERLRDALEEYTVATIARRLMDATLAEYEKEQQPRIIKRAEEIFSAMTQGRYLRLATPLGEFSLTVEDASSQAKQPDRLSRGTKEQLYLALRLAYVENLTDVDPALPVLMDDILVNFDDDGRQAEAARAIAAFAERRQVILFTCHRSTADLLAEVAPESTRVEIGRCG